MGAPHRGKAVDGRACSNGKQGGEAGQLSIVDNRERADPECGGRIRPARSRIRQNSDAANLNSGEFIVLAIIPFALNSKTRAAMHGQLFRLNDFPFSFAGGVPW
jgi:hypothetical protein